MDTKLIPTIFNSLLCLSLAIMSGCFDSKKSHDPSSQSTLNTNGECHNLIKIYLNETITMDFCEIPAHSNFPIGHEQGEFDERPVKNKNFQAFHIGRFEVTQLEYKIVTGEQPWKGKNHIIEGDHYPAVYVNVPLFIERLNKFDPNSIYRLPTESEWEYAASGKTRSQYYWGNNMDASFAFYWENSTKTFRHPRDVKTCPDPDRHLTTPNYCANGFGLMHMAGNVWELVSDYYIDHYNVTSINGHEPITSDKAKTSGPQDKEKRIVRGGSWTSSARNLRTSYRQPTSAIGYDVGFRLVRIPRHASGLN